MPIAQHTECGPYPGVGISLGKGSTDSFCLHASYMRFGFKMVILVWYILGWVSVDYPLGIALLQLILPETTFVEQQTPSQEHKYYQSEPFIKKHWCPPPLFNSPNWWCLLSTGSKEGGGNIRNLSKHWRCLTGRETNGNNRMDKVTWLWKDTCVGGTLCWEIVNTENDFWHTMCTKVSRAGMHVLSSVVLEAFSFKVDLKTLWHWLYPDLSCQAWS